MSQRAEQIAAKMLGESYVDPATPILVPPKGEFCSLNEVIGKEYAPPHVNVDPDTELSMAEKSGFTAWELAQRRNINHPRLLKAVTGTPYEPMYRRQFDMDQRDPFYASSSAPPKKAAQAPAQAQAQPPAPAQNNRSKISKFFDRFRSSKGTGF